MKYTERNETAGRIFVKGTAKKTFTCDRVNITITFFSNGLSCGKTSETAMAQCEKFLQRLSDKGIDLSQLTLENDSISQHHHDTAQVSASRTVCLRSEARVSVINFLMEIIQQEHLEAEISTHYDFSDESALRRTLLSEAIADSRANAELLATAAGKTIIGVDFIDMNTHTRPSRRNALLQPEGFASIMHCFSKELSLPEKEISETVEVAWLIG